VLIASIPGDEESVAAAVAAHPDRFHAYSFFDPTGSDAPARAESAISRGIRGICLFPAMHRYSLADDRVREALNIVARHPGGPCFAL
jgi:predicted TIM-barrel fold metal-dependent hydrolase